MGTPELKDGDSIEGIFLVRSKQVSTSRTGNLFITITLANKNGDLDGKIWDEAEEMGKRFNKDDFIKIRGRITSYQGARQINIKSLERVEDDMVDVSLFIPASKRDIEEMVSELRSEIDRINNPHLKGLLSAFSDDPEFMALFKKAPAAKGVHHVYIGGLLEHTLELVMLCRDIIRHYPDADADLLVTGAILHDAGKVYELGYKKSIDYTDEGRLIGHILLGFRLVEEKIRMLEGFPKDLAMLLEHIIISHQGRYEWGSPKRPKTLEALILHYLDEMNAKIKSFHETFEREKINAENTEDQTGWSSYNRIFERFLYNRRYREK
ncbi:MAG: HD domain-containing protein [Nitrospirota bacterium]